jgi:hypothetical protein
MYIRKRIVFLSNFPGNMLGSRQQGNISVYFINYNLLYLMDIHYKHAKGFDRHPIEDGLANAILTLPPATQQEILLAWFNRFLNSGEDCPNIQRGFEVWRRRAFWKRNVEPEQPAHLRITAICENS